MNIAEIICPVCKKSNLPDAVVCGYCGARLGNHGINPEIGTQTTNMPVTVSEGEKDWSVNETAVPKNGIAVFAEGEFKPVHIDSRQEFVLGRKSGKTAQAQEDLVDLAPLGGYARGVSRRHMVIRRMEQGYEVLDLGSVNGSWLNDKRLVPHKSYPLESGSHVRLGNMRLLVLYSPFGELKKDS